MGANVATQEEMENVAILEQYAVTLRFHGCDDSADAAEQKANQIRAEVWQRQDVEAA